MKNNDMEERLRRHADTVRESMAPLNIDPAGEERKDVKMPKKRIGLIAAAAIVAVAGITAMAATLKWDEGMLKFLHLTPEQAEKLEDSAAYPEVSVTDNGVTVTVRQTLTDSHGIYVLYDIEAPEGFEFTDDTRFGGAVFDPDCGITSDSSSTGWDNRTLSQSGNKRTALLCYNTDGRFKSGRATMIFKDLGYRDTEYRPEDDPEVTTVDNGGGVSIQYRVADSEPTDSRDPADRSYLKYGFVKQIEGRWELSWDFDYVDAARVIEPELKYHNDKGNEYTVKKIELSPMSIWVETEHSMEMEAVQVEPGDAVATYTVQMPPQPLVPVIKMKDGSTVKFSERIGFGYGTAYLDGRPGGLQRQSWNFEDGIIDLSLVESITFGESTVYLSEE